MAANHACSALTHRCGASWQALKALYETEDDLTLGQPAKRRARVTRSRRVPAKLADAGLQDEAAAVSQPVAAEGLDGASDVSEVAVRLSAVHTEIDKLKARHRCAP